MPACEALPATVDGKPQTDWLYCRRCERSVFGDWRPWQCYQNCFAGFKTARHIEITPLEK